MRGDGSVWFWRGLWVLGLLIAGGILALYGWLPTDGATGDLMSFTPQGFRVQWIMEEREGGLRAGDVIVRAGGHTVDEWLAGAQRGREWEAGGIVTYEVLRDGSLDVLEVRMAPVSLATVVRHWAPQFIVVAIYLAVGSYVFYRRPWESTARLVMLFCIMAALQHTGDAYNFQYTTLVRRWPFWLHLALEQGSFGLIFASACHFALAFPFSRTTGKRLPRLAVAAIYAVSPAAIALTVGLSGSWSRALPISNLVSLGVAMLQGAVGLLALTRTARTVHDPLVRSQARWFLSAAWGWATLALVGYAFPLMLSIRPLVSHPVIVLLTGAIPLSLAVVVLRYHLWDIDLIVSRTLVYTMLVALLSGIYVLLVRVLTLLVQGVLRAEDDTLVVFVATLGVVLAFNPLRQRVKALVDRTFYRTKLDYQRMLPEMSARLSTCIVPGELARLLTEELPRQLQIAWASLIVLDPTGELFVPVDGGGDRPVLRVDHPLVEYLRGLDRPLRRLQAPSDLPPEALAVLERDGVELSIPLVVGTQMVGLYSLGPKRSTDAYSNDEVRTLHVLGQQAAVAVENSRLFHETERQARELAILHESAVAVSASLEVEEALYTLAERLGRTLGVTSVFICDWEEGTTNTTVLAEWSGPEATDVERQSGRGASCDLQQHPAVLQALRDRLVLIAHASDPHLDPADELSARHYGWKSHLIVPLVIHDQVIGYAELWETRRERGFSPAEVQLCETLAADAAAAVDHARLFQAERDQRILAEALQEAAALVSGTLDLDEVLDRILEQVEKVVAGDAFNIMMVEGNTVRAVRWRGYDKLGAVDLIAGLRIPITAYLTLVGMVERREPAAVSDTRADPRWRALAGWEWLRSYVAAPIIVTGMTVGFVQVDGARPGQFGPDDARRLQAFAHHAATAIRNAWLYQETSRRLAQTEVLREVMLAAASTLDFDQVLERTFQTLQSAMGVQFLGVALPDCETGGLKYRRSRMGDPPDPVPSALPLEGSVCGRVFRTGDPVLLADVREVSHYYGDAGEMRSELAVPIRAGGEVIGVLDIESRRLNAFDKEDLALYTVIAGQLGVALQNARLYQEVRRHADELAAALARSQELDRLKSQFIQNVSHELRSPVALIRGYAELLAAGELGRLEAEQEGPVATIARRAQMLSSLVEDITLILLVEARPLAQERIGLGELARAAVEDFRVAADQAGLTLKAEIGEGLPAASGEGTYLRRVIDNLLGNAVKFTPAGGTITVGVREGEGELVLEVSDTGIGIPEDQQERIFDRFYQIDGSARRRYGGAGLGLALVKEIVEAHGGTVRVSSSPKQGSTFAITLPAVGTEA